MNTSNYEAEEGEVFRFEYKINQQKQPLSIKSYHPQRRRSTNQSDKQEKKNVRSLKLKAVSRNSGIKSKAKQVKNLEPIPSESSRECHIVEQAREGSTRDQNSLDIESIVQITTGNVIKMLKDNPKLLNQIMKEKNKEESNGKDSPLTYQETSEKISDLVVKSIINTENLRDDQKADQKHLKGELEEKNKIELKKNDFKTPTKQREFNESQGLIEMRNALNFKKNKNQFDYNPEDLESFIETKSFLESKEIKKINKTDISNKLTKSFSKIIKLDDEKNLTEEIELNQQEKGIPISRKAFSTKTKNSLGDVEHDSDMVKQVLRRVNMLSGTEEVYLKKSLNSEKVNKTYKEGQLNVKKEQILFSTLQPRTLPNTLLIKKKKQKKLKPNILAKKKFYYKSEIDDIFKNHMNETKQNRFFRSILRSKSPIKNKFIQSSQKEKPSQTLNLNTVFPSEISKRSLPYPIEHEYPRKTGSFERKIKIQEYPKSSFKKENDLKIGDELPFIYKTLNSKSFRVIAIQSNWKI